jgi:hypothetical protein
MKYGKLLFMVMITTILVVTGIIRSENVYASTDRQYYYEAGTYYIDLDGDGKWETVSYNEYTETYRDYYGNTFEVLGAWELVINGKSSGKKYIRNPINDGDYCTYIRIELIDIYEKDKYTEIGIRFLTDDPTVDDHYEAYRYKSGKCELVFSEDHVGQVWDKQKKKNHLMVEEYELCDLGAVFYKVDYVIEDKELVKAKNKDRVCEYCSCQDEFTANQSITIYKKNSLKKKVGKIAKGETFKVYKLKFSKSGKIVAAYVKSSKGVKGWIDVNTGYPRDRENGIVKDPFYWG